MRRVQLIFAGLLLWSFAYPASARVPAEPRPNPLREAAAGAVPYQPAAATAPTEPDSGEQFPPEIPGSAQAAPGGNAPVVMDARIGEHSDRTRFVVEFSEPMKFGIFTLASPDRLVIDMPEVLWRLGVPPTPNGRGAIRSYRYGLFRPGNSRFVVDLNQPVKMGKPLVLLPQDHHGYRLVLDLFPTTQTAFEKSAGWPAALRARERAAAEMASLPPPGGPGATSRQPPKSASEKIVVVDPGHGGIDSGTIGVTGLEEKDLVLAEGKLLAKALRARGYKVYMTRKTDVFIPLFQRAPLAQRHRADLFVSLHADSNPGQQVSGLSVYTLSERGSDKEAAALARKENQSDIIAGVDLSGENATAAPILLALLQRDTMNRSSRFATTVVRELSHATDILPRRPHRSANFVVLRSPDVPSVLVELGYLSNRQDCRQMATSAWRNRVASALAGAVERHLGAAMVRAPGREEE